MTSLSLGFAHGIYERIRRIEDELQGEAFLSETEWLILPMAKRETVLRRLRALREYDVLAEPTADDAIRAAKKAGVAIARFYQLVAHWRSRDRSPFSLVPYQSLGAERPTRLAAAETARAITAAIMEILARDPLTPTGAVVSHLRRTWRGPGELPTDTALRAFHERAIRHSKPVPGTLTLSGAGSPQEDDVVAERFAETLVIDHVSVKHLVAFEDGLQPTVTLAIDLWSGSPLGAVALAESPSPRGLLLALQDAASRLDRNAGRGEGAGVGLPPRRPRLVIATTFAKRWRGAVDALLSHGFEIVERREIFLQQGGPSRRLLGMRLGPLHLDRRASRRDWIGIDIQNDAVQPLSTIQEILTRVVDSHADDRVPRDAWASAGGFAIAPPFDALASEGRGAAVGGPDHDRDKGIAEAGGSDEVRDLLARLAEERVPGGARDVRIRRGEDEVWHLIVTVGDPGDRDAAFMSLAQGSMTISAAKRVPIVVHVEVAGGN